MQHRVFAAFFPTAEVQSLPADQRAELDHAAEVLTNHFLDKALDFSAVRWRERVTRYGDAMRAALQAVTAIEPTVLGGWAMDPQPDDSILNPNPKPGEPKWWPIDGASFHMSRRGAAPGASGAFLSLVRMQPASESEVTAELTLTNDSGQPATRFDVALSRRRTHLVAVSARTAKGAVIALKPATGAAGVHEATLTAPLAPNATLVLVVTFHGDLPFVRETRWNPSTPAVTQPEYANERAEFAERERRVGLHTGDRRRFGEFFLDLDRRSTAAAATDPLVAVLGGYLARRIRIRAEDAGIGVSVAPLTTDAVEWAKAAIKSANIVADCIRRHFSNGGAVDIAAVSKAFTQFAAGRLRELDSHGAPNGPSYFCFAELALLMLEAGHDTHLWGSLLRPFAATAELFARVAHQCAGPRHSAAYGAAYDPQALRGASDALAAEIHDAWAKVKDVRYAFGRLLHAALAAEVRGATLTPLHLPDVGCSANPAPGPTDPAASDREWRGA